MTRNEELYEKYEEALFALLMVKITDKEGERYLEECGRLNQDPSAEIPESLDRRCHRTIKRAFLKNKMRETFRIIRVITSKVAVVAIVALLLFASAYALIPEFRIMTLNLLIARSDVSANLTFGWEENGEVNTEQHIEFSGYWIPTVPEGFSIVSHGHDSRSDWMTYKDNKGAVIYFEINGNSTSVYSVDIEDADNVEQLIIHGYEGLLIEKGTRVHIVWGDTDQGKYVNVICDNIDKDIVIDLVNGMHK